MNFLSFGWGSSEAGKLGVGEVSTGVYQTSTPILISGVNNPVAVLATHDNSLALDANGQVWIWGGNTYGQFADGGKTASISPKKIDGLNNVKEISGGFLNFAALKNDGSVWLWGDNSSGQLANGSKTNPKALVPLDLSDVISIKGAQSHYLALKKDGSVWIWGETYRTQSGSTTTTSATPVRITEIDNVRAIRAGDAHNLMLRADGSVWAFGMNLQGQLGNGTTSGSSAPVQATGLQDVSDLCAGSSLSVAVKKDGSVWAWGHGVASNPNATQSANSLLPVQVARLENIANISCHNHGLALKRDGSVWSWGNNSNGQTGNGQDLSYSSGTGDVVVAGGVVGVGGSGTLNLGPVPENTDLTVSATTSGTLAKLTLEVSLSVASRDTGTNGQLYIVAVLPNGALYSFTPQGWQGGGTLLPYATTKLGTHNVTLLDGSLDISTLAGTVIYMGYGIDVADMQTGKKYSRVYTLK